LKFLFISDFEYNPNSGAGGSLLIMGEALEQQGHIIKYIWRKEKRVVQSNNLYRFLELPLVQYNQIADYFEKQGLVDVVIASQPHCWLAFKKLKKRFPEVLFINRTHGWEMRIAPEYWKLKHKNSSVLRSLKNKLTYILLKDCSLKTVRYSDAVLCASTDDTGFIQSSYPQYRNRIFTISYGLSKEFIGIKLPEVSEERVLSFIYVGQYTERKGIQDILDLFKSCTQSFKLSFIINQDALARAQSDFEEVPNVSFYSWMDRADLIQHYITHDVFLMPSYGEGFGKTNLEAMACGLCVLGYREGALSDIGRDKENALLAVPGDFKSLKANFEWCFKNPGRVRELSKQAYRDVQELTWEQFASKTLKIIHDLI